MWERALSKATVSKLSNCSLKQSDPKQSDPKQLNSQPSLFMTLELCGKQDLESPKP